MKITKEDARIEIQNALREGIYAGTPEFDRIADLASVFGISIQTIKITTDLETGYISETPVTFPPPRN